MKTTDISEIKVKLIHFFCPFSSLLDEMTPPLPFAPSPRAARTGSIKAGGLLFVLDHFRWTQPMRDSIDGLLTKYHGQKDLLTQVDSEYAALVQAASRDPNSLLHPTTKLHISRYVKHLAKMTNTSSSLNTSPEKLLETQQLWHHLTQGSETVTFKASFAAIFV